MFPLLARWNEFAVTPMEAPLDGSIRKVAHRGIHANQITTDNVYESTTE
jgi:hypothetical protein